MRPDYEDTEWRQARTYAPEDGLLSKAIQWLGLIAAGLVIGAILALCVVG